MAVEMTTLRQRLLDRRRPGAQLTIKRMEKLDHSLAELRAAAANINPASFKRINTTDPMLRRLVYLTINDLISQLVDVMRQVANVNVALELTDENTELTPEPIEVTHAYEELCKNILDEVICEKKRADHSKMVMFDMLDFMVDAYLKGELKLINC